MIVGIDFKGIQKPQKIRAWIQDGADFEDSRFRFLHHFHNPLHQATDPLRPWTTAGLNDLFSGNSSLLWAQSAGSQINLDWDWMSTRLSFYNALTLPSKTERELQFARLFSGLGHLIHLIQDLAQPAHVRNDAHPLEGIGLLDGLESWAEAKRETVQRFSENPIFPTLSLNPVHPVNSQRLQPISPFWDTDQYDGTAATVGLTTGLTVGLAEYTNANFFSEDTINASNPAHQFPYPSIQLQDYFTCADDAPPNSLALKRWYLSRTPCPQNPQSTPPDHFLALSLLGPALPPQPLHISPASQLDDRVREDYARALIPRAVGYSAGLIDYFFRGQLAVRTVPGGLRIRNASNEAMAPYLDPDTGDTVGTISIYYDDMNQTRKLLATYDLTAALAPGQETPAILFTPPPDNLTPGRYIVVFRGKLGQEEGAVVGKLSQEFIYYVSNQNGLEQIFRMDLDGGNATVVYDNMITHLDIGRIAVSPDGRTLVFGAGASPQTSQLHLFELSSSPDTPAVVLTPGDSPNWSPDGTRIVFERETGKYLPSQADIEIFIRDIQTGIETPLTNVSGPSVSQHPVWSPDGASIVYSRFNTNPQEPNCANLYVITLMDVTGQSLGPLSCDPSVAYVDISAAWSPDGQAMVFTRRHPARQYHELNRLEVGTGAVSKLTDSDGTGYDELWPVWSPDGTHIAVGSGRDGDADIWLVDPNGTGYLVNLTGSHAGIDEFPAYGR